MDSTASLIDEFVPGQMITGTGADIIFRIPVMRQMMAWIGTMPAKRKNITKTFEKGTVDVLLDQHGKSKHTHISLYPTESKMVT